VIDDDDSPPSAYRGPRSERVISLKDTVITCLKMSALDSGDTRQLGHGRYEMHFGTFLALVTFEGDLQETNT
jgi:hypothetical protein